MRSRPVATVLSAAAIVLLSGLLAACSKQGQGERCSKENGNDDCESPLICGEKGVCCPESDRNCGGATPTDAAVDTGSPADTGSGDTGPGDTGPGDTGPGDTGPADTGPGDTGPGDTGPADTSSDAPSDGSTSDADAGG